jgi:SAM-dependent methyltransferase
MTGLDPDEQARTFAAASLAADDPTGWFERLYSAADEGTAVLPWDRGEAHPLLAEWAHDRELAGSGRRALVVGCGLGYDAELLARLGYDTVAFDVSASAVAATRRRFPDSVVSYVAADLLDLPSGWLRAYDLVVEIFTVQALPIALHGKAIAQVGQVVGPGGTLLVIAGGRAEADQPDGPPWPLTRTEVDSFGTDGLDALRIEDLRDESGGNRRWRAEFRRS